MKLKKIFALLLIILSFNIISTTAAEARWHRGWHAGRGWHHHRWGWRLPLVVPYSYTYHHRYVYPRYSVTRANHYIALGRHRINQGHWYINHGYPQRGAVLINKGRVLIAKGNVILRRY